MSVMVNQNGLYVPVSDILLPNGNAHENVLDASGNEYFSKETFPVQLHVQGNETGVIATASGTSSASKTKTLYILDSDNNYVELSRYIGKQLSIKLDIKLDPSNKGEATVKAEVYADENLFLNSTKIKEYSFSWHSNAITYKENLNINIPELTNTSNLLKIKVSASTSTSTACVRSASISVISITINNT